MPPEQAERTNFRFTLAVSLSLALIGLWHTLLVTGEALDLEELAWAPAGVLFAAGVKDYQVVAATVVVALSLYVLLIAVCIALRPRRWWALLLFGSAGVLPSVLGVYLSVAYVLGWPPF